jgi:hypothetical protein
MGKVQINYKSGQSVVVKCSSFKFVRKGSDMTVEWSNDAKPRPLLIGVDDIESIWEL